MICAGARCGVMVTTKFEEIRDNLPQIEAWLQRGEEIELTRNGHAMAHVVPVIATETPVPACLVKADLAARMKQIWGERVFSDEEVREMREYELGDRS